MLEAWHFSSGANFEFGARSRDYGYLPRTTADFQAWFGPVLQATEAYAVDRTKNPPANGYSTTRFSTASKLMRELPGWCGH